MNTKDKDSIYYFPLGLFGFEIYNYFTIEDLTLSERFIGKAKLMLSTEDSTIKFVIMKPEDCHIYDYIPDLNPIDIEKISEHLEEQSIKKLDLYFTLTMKDNNFEDATLNLMGPILIDPVKETGLQVLSFNPAHTVRHRLFSH